MLNPISTGVGFLFCLEVVVLWLETQKKEKRKKVSIYLIASLAPARAEIEAGVVAKADQYWSYFQEYGLNLSTVSNILIKF